MEIKNFLCTYFSPTGGTANVAKTVSGELCDKTEYIDITSGAITEHVLSKDDILTVAVPVFGGRIPSTVAARLDKFHGDNTPCVLIAVYGNRAYEDALLEMCDIMQKNGFVIIAAGAAIAPHSIAPIYGANRPDEADIKEIKAFVQDIKNKLDKVDNITAADNIEVPGNRPYREYNGVPFKPSTDKSCDGCGACARACPVGAIDMGDCQKVDKNTCISCMRCISICPKKAKSIGKMAQMLAKKMLGSKCSQRQSPEFFV